MTRIAAAGEVGTPPAAVFAFLSDLRNHWQLTGRWVALDGLSGPMLDPTGGTVALRGPLGLRRTVSTRVVRAAPATELLGSARIGPRTRAAVRWTIAPSGHGSLVGLEATVLEASLPDRVLLRAGGARWMRRRFDETIARLDVEIGAWREAAA